MIIDCERERKKMEKKLAEMDEKEKRDLEKKKEKEKKIVEKEVDYVSAEADADSVNADSSMNHPRFEYAFPHPPMQPPFHHLPYFSFRFTMVDGDGTVPTFSAANDCLGSVARFEVKNVEHMALLWDKRILNIIANILGIRMPFPKVL
jgi:hypothetical protein